MHAAYKMKDPQPDLLEYLLNVFICLPYVFVITKIYNLMQLVSNEKIAGNRFVLLYKTSLSTKS